MADLCTFEDVQAQVGELVADKIGAAALEDLCDGTATTLGYIAEKSAWFEEMTGRTYGGTATKTIKLDGNGTNMVMLPDEFNDATVTALQYDVGGTAQTVESTDYEVTEDGRVVLVNTAAFDGDSRFDFARFQRGRANVQATLAYGKSNIPADVRGAVWRMVCIAVLNKYALLTSRGVESKTLGDRREAYGSGGQFSGTEDSWQKYIDDVISKHSGGLQAGPGYVEA